MSRATDAPGSHIVVVGCYEKREPNCIAISSECTILMSVDRILHYLLIAGGMWVVGVAASVLLVVIAPADLGCQPSNRPLWARIALNALGWSLIAVGTILLPTPLNGIILVFIGLALAEFPGKRSLLYRLAKNDRMVARINAIRRRFGRPAVRVEFEDSC